MVYFMETPIKIHDLGVYIYIPLFLVQHPYEIPYLINFQISSTFQPTRLVLELGSITLGILRSFSLWSSILLCKTGKQGDLVLEKRNLFFSRFLKNVVLNIMFIYVYYLSLFISLLFGDKYLKFFRVLCWTSRMIIHVEPTTLNKAKQG